MVKITPAWRNLATALPIVVAALWPVLARAQEAEEAKRVRVLLVLDTDDKQGASWGLDGENMKEVLEALFARQNLEGRVAIDMFTGAQADPKKVLAYYQGLKTGPDEALVFYYSGHGRCHPSRGHFIAFARGPLYRSDLIKAMQAQSPRLTVVMTDCCANVVPNRGGGGTGLARREEPRSAVEPIPGNNPAPAGPRARKQEPPALVLQPGPGERPPLFDPPRPDLSPFFRTRPKAERKEPPAEEAKLDSEPRPAGPKAKRQEPRGDLPRRALRTGNGLVPLEEIVNKADGGPLRHLLFQHKGLVDINGCQKGKLSHGTVQWGGSLFTIGFLELQREGPQKFDKNDDGFVTWSEFFPAWQHATERAGFRVMGRPNAQVPEAWQMKVEPTKK